MSPQLDIGLLQLGIVLKEDPSFKGPDQVLILDAKTKNKRNRSQQFSNSMRFLVVIKFISVRVLQGAQLEY